MSEIEFLKANPNLKQYHKMFEKELPKAPTNKIKIDKILKIVNLPFLNSFLRRNKLDFNLSTLLEKNDFEIKQNLKFSNDDKISVVQHSKSLSLELHLPFLDSQLKVLF